MMPIRSLVPIVLIASLVAANPALAQDGGRIVSYADLDLNSPADTSTLDRRIGNAIRQVCGRSFPTDLQSHSQVRRCRAATASDVQAQRNDALAQAQNGRIQLSAGR